MAEKQKYVVNRAMQDGANEYSRGDTREMTEIDAAPLLAIGALSKPGEEPAEREPAVQHTFGAAPTEQREYTSAGEGSVQLERTQNTQQATGTRRPAKTQKERG